MFDNKVGAMTNSPELRLASSQFAQLREPAGRWARAPSRNINGVSLAPFGAGSGMLGLPGDFTPPSRFIRAVAFVNTMQPGQGRSRGRLQRPVDDVEQLRHSEGPCPRGREPRGLSTLATPNGRSSPTPGTRSIITGPCTTGGMRSVDFSKLNFDASKASSFPLDRVRTEDIEDRSDDFAH